MHSVDHQFVISLVGVCLFLFFIATLRHYGRNSFLPPESWILLAGLVYGYLQHYHLPALPVVELSPTLVIWLLLPILIFASGRNISPRALSKEWLSIFSYAGLGVVMTLFLIGIPLSWALKIPLLDGLFFAAAVAATDPSAVAAIFQRFTIPERLSILLEGESIFNDGTAIVVFGLLGSLVLASQQLNLGQAFIDFGWSILSAIPLGIALGWVAGRLVDHWQEQNKFSGLTLTIVIAYGGYIIAETVLHASGVIAVLCTALAFVRFRSKGDSPRKGELFVGFWEYLETLAGSVLFFALGVAVGGHEFPLSWAIPGVILMLLGSRVVVVYGLALLLNLVRQRVALSWQHILLLGGLRGAVSAALVLMIPYDYAYRIEMLCLVFVLCLYTLVVHPPLLRLYLQRGTIDD